VGLLVHLLLEVIGTGGTAPVASVSTGDPHNPVYNTQKLVQSLDVLCMASDG
jgi:hypothetical protein